MMISFLKAVHGKAVHGAPPPVEMRSESDCSRAAADAVPAALLR
jgi:hypothetical protein